MTKVEAVMFKKILVPLDGSLLSEAALAPAIDLAKHYDAEIELAIISLIPTLYHVIDENVLKTDLESCRVYIERAAGAVRDAGVRVSTHVGEGAPAVARAIVRRAEAWGADIIILSSHGQGSVERLVLGSVAERVSHMARMPVMLVHPH
jgi:nucleotide-binding universal stress UspA family protein